MGRCVAGREAESAVTRCGGASQAEERWARGRSAAVAAALAVITAATFMPLRSAQFLNLDDNVYVTQNGLVPRGVTWEGLRWAVSTAEFNWHPLTWLSHMVDCQLFGLNAGAHHLSSVALHALNSGLLLYVLFRLSRDLWPSAFTAALFALHPLHVEPVAWIAARKDLLSTAWWLAAFLAYVRYTERPTRPRWALVGLAMALSLMSKGMAVTLPALLLLLDYWPLRRWSIEPGLCEPPAARGASPSRGHLIMEKLPLVVLALAGMVVQVVAQRLSGALRSLDQVPVHARIANALVAYGAYGAKMVWPVDLAVPYPLHPRLPPVWQVAAAATWLVCASAVVAAWCCRRRYLLTGWLWYLVTLLPVIGLVSIGAQSMADRYTYVPLVGLFMIVAWAGADLGRLYPPTRSALAGAAVLIVLVCAGLTRQQIGYWRDSLTLFRHTLAVTEDNIVAAVNAGAAADEAGYGDEALAHFAEALRINAQEATAHFGLTLALIRHGDLDAAREHMRMAESLRPFRGNSVLENNLGVALKAAGRAAEAREHFAAAVRLDPGNAEAHNNLGVTMAEAGRAAEAEPYFQEAVRLQPNYVSARVNLGLARLQQGDAAGAQEHFAIAAALDPNQASLLESLTERMPANGAVGGTVGSAAK